MHTDIVLLHLRVLKWPEFSVFLIIFFCNGKLQEKRFKSERICPFVENEKNLRNHDIVGLF